MTYNGNYESATKFYLESGSPFYIGQVRMFGIPEYILSYRNKEDLKHHNTVVIWKVTPKIKPQN